MSEIAKCPVCGKDVKQSIWRPEYESCGGSVVVTVKCCGVEAVTISLWNQYAAAMDLYAALKCLYDKLLMSDRDGQSHISEKDGEMALAALCKALAALCKATGEA